MWPFDKPKLNNNEKWEIQELRRICHETGDDQLKRVLNLITAVYKFGRLDALELYLAAFVEAERKIDHN